MTIRASLAADAERFGPTPDPRPFPGTLSLRRSSPQDATAAGTICFTAFKAIAESHGFPGDFPAVDDAIGLVSDLVTRDDVHAVTAEVDGRVVGTNFLWKNGSVAGVGPITVDPSIQNRRVGRSLMNAVIEHARQEGLTSVRLVQAAYHGRSLSLYTRLGFDPREPLAVMQGSALNLAIDGWHVRNATRADVVSADSLYRHIHGHTRTGDLEAAIAQGTARIVEHAGRMTGYTTGIGFFGHAVGRTTQDLQALIGAADGFAGPGFLVPIRNGSLLRWCLEHGLRFVQPMTLISLGWYDDPKGAFMPSVLY